MAAWRLRGAWYGANAAAILQPSTVEDDQHGSRKRPASRFPMSVLFPCSRMPVKPLSALGNRQRYRSVENALPLR
jgi:hypothetical protein